MSLPLRKGWTPHEGWTPPEGWAQMIAAIGIGSNLDSVHGTREGSLREAVHRMSALGEIAYLTRRFVPGPERFATIGEYAVRGGDRLDLIAAARLGDPERYWILCDANNALRPEELTDVPGRRLRITLPQDIPATPQ